MKRTILRFSRAVLLAAFVGCIGISMGMAQMGGAGSPGGNNMGGAGTNPPASPGANAPGASNAMPGQQNPMAASMQTSFLHSIAENSLAENELSKMAMDKSSNDNVKQMAQQVMQEHQKLDTALSGAAKASSFSMPKKAPGRVRKDEKKMQTLSGPQFDQAYLTELNNYEKKDQSLAKDMAQQASSPNMKQFSNAVHNMAENHTQQIAQIAKSENVDLKK